MCKEDQIHSTALSSVSEVPQRLRVEHPALKLTLLHHRDPGNFVQCAQPRGSNIRPMTKHRIYTMSFASVYPLYVAKAEKKGRTKAEVDEVIRWLTGYSQKELEAHLKKQTDCETFFAEATQMNPSRSLIKGTVCGVRVEDIEEPTMREIRYLDKLVDELAKGKVMEKILRK
jgi:hypothetical protein